MNVSDLSMLCRIVLAVITLLWLTACSQSSHPEHKPGISISAPRDYGFTIGDLIEHTLTIDTSDTESLNTSALPQPGAINDWLTLRSLNWQNQRINGREHYQIHITYQAFKGVQRPENVVIPSLPLHVTGSDTQEIQTPEWTFTLTPVIPPELQNEEVEIRDALPPEPIATAAVWQRLKAWAGLVIVGIVLWGLRFYLSRTRFRPFTQACRLMRPHRTRNDEESLRASARLLHRAFDQTQGETLFLEDIDQFCKQHPAFAHLHERLIEFFTHSQILFFGTASPPDINPLSIEWLTDFGRRCAAAERSSL